MPSSSALETALELTQIAPSPRRERKDSLLNVSVDDLTDGEKSRLLLSLVIPRPIAWVSTVSADGHPNLAPHSFYTIVSAHPPIVMFASTLSSRFRPDGQKDTLANILETGEFVINFASKDLLTEIVVTAGQFAPDFDEFDAASLKKLASVDVAPPRVAAARAALECRLHHTLPMGDAICVFGDVVRFHVDDDMLEDGRPSALDLQPIARLGGAHYGTLDKEIIGQ